MSHPFLPRLSRPLILASRSPRRQELLRAQGLEFEVQPARLEETILVGESPVEHVRRLSVEKAEAVAADHFDSVVLGSDTVVVVDGEILGKPADPAEARGMLRRLAGRTHRVFSGVALVCADGGRSWSDHDETEVRFRPLDDEEIAAYVASGEPMDKAGAYGIQALGALLVDGIDGCYFNVMGLPLQALRRIWHEAARELSASGKKEGG